MPGAAAGFFFRRAVKEREALMAGRARRFHRATD
jgi:hypothetical protein